MAIGISPASRIAAFVFIPVLATKMASAAFVTPSYRPANTTAAAATLTTYQEWNVFTSKTSNSPNAGYVNPNDTNTPSNHATVGDTSGNAFITSDTHLYALNGPLSVNVVIPAYPTSTLPTQFIVQIENDGSELIPKTAGVPDFSGFKIDGIALSTLAEFQYTELSRHQNMIDVGPPAGVVTTNDVESEFVFNLPSSLTDPLATSHTFTYTVSQNNAEYHIAVDTIEAVVPAPEPAALSLTAVFASALLRRRRTVR